MATGKKDILGWVQEGKRIKATHVVVICDTFDYDDYPVYVKVGQDANKIAAEYGAKSMQKVMEIIPVPKRKKKKKK